MIPKSRTVMQKKYWAALDKENFIIAIGLTVNGQRFDRRCFDFSVQCMERWLLGGAKYCSIQQPPLGGRSNIAQTKYHIDNFSHGKISASKEGLSFLKRGHVK